MDKLTAIRSFASPGFTPARRVKIFNDHWYLVTMQNVERGQGDYLGLGEGEYSELLPGDKARERRDARLNHCNSIAEHSGPVFELLANQYGGDVRHVGYFATPKDASTKLDQCKTAYDKWIGDCRAEGDRHLKSAIAIEQGIGKSIMTAEMHRDCARDCFAVVDKHASGFRCDLKQIR
jgi:hypothetical protein